MSAERLRLSHGEGVPPGMVAVTCWCERKIVAVPQAWIVSGLTSSCGVKGCRA